MNPLMTKLVAHYNKKGWLFLDIIDSNRAGTTGLCLEIFYEDENGNTHIETIIYRNGEVIA